MPARIHYKEGDKIGKATYVRDIEPPYIVPASGQTQRRAVFRCKCGREYEQLINVVKSGRCYTCPECSEKRRLVSKCLPGDQTGFRLLFRRYRDTAAEDGRVFALTEEEFRRLTKGDCYYCGVPPLRESIPKSKRKSAIYVYNGIDRLDSELGYVLENCVPCCWHCNIAKGTLSPEAFIDWAVKVKNFNQPLKEYWWEGLDLE